MRTMWISIKSCIVFYLVLFAGQSLLFVFDPPYHAGSPDQAQIPAFIHWSFAKYFTLIALAYVLWAIVLGALNGLAFRLSRTQWKSSSWISWPALAWCSAQFCLLLLLVGFFYPAMYAQIPGLDRLPLVVSYLLLGLLSVALASTTLRSQTDKRSRHLAIWSLAGLAPLALIALSTRPAALNFSEARDGDARHSILLLGFDAMDGDSGNATLSRALQNIPARVFNNAFTPLPLTHPAWNSILSGQYPEKHQVRFFFGSPHAPKHPQLNLPLRLKQEAGFQTLFASDLPETSFFLASEGFDASLLPTVGWKAHMGSMLLNHFILPAVWLNNATAESLFGAIVNTPGLFNYDPIRFFNSAFRGFSEMISDRRFLALHSCYLHTPIRLTRRELLTLPHYLHLSPRDFSFAKWPKAGESKPTTPAQWINPYYLRRELALNLLEEIVLELKKKNYLKNSTVVFLSDHGERFLKSYEIYGGIHGVDIETREQNNIMFALANPSMGSFSVDSRWTSLIDIAPTLLGFAELPIEAMPYDGSPVVSLDGKTLPLPERPILIESMGFIDDATERDEFPQLSIKSLEESLIYKEAGEVIVGSEYYDRILKKKTFADLTQVPEMRRQVAERSSHGPSISLPRLRYRNLRR